MYFFQIIRWKNLLMIALLQALIAYHLIPLFNASRQLSDFQFVVVVLATLFITAAGYIINDLHDVPIDRINRPEKTWIPRYLSTKNAFILYMLLTGIGLALALFLSVRLDNYWNVLLFIIPIILLYLYAIYLQKILLVGNILVSLLIVYSLFILMILEKQMDTQESLVQVVLVLGSFAFLLNFAREIVKDTQDRIGDAANGVRSIPIRYGMKGSVRFVEILVGITIFLVVFLAVYLFNTQLALSLYLITGVLSGLFLFLSQLHKAKKETDFDKLSTLLKLLMFVGIIAVLFIKPF